VTEEDLDAELRFDLEQRVADKIAAGMSEADARRAARLEFGGIEQIKEECRDQSPWRFLSSFWQDVRYAVRTMRRSAGFTAVAVATLALGIGATTAVFTLTDAVLLKSLPVHDAGDLVVLGKGLSAGVTGIGQESFSLYSWELYLYLKDSGVFHGLCAFKSEDLRVSVLNTGWLTPQARSAGIVSGNYFEVLEAPVARGRALGPDDDVPGATPVAVVGYRYWTDALRQPAMGSVIRLNGIPVTIVGVAAPEFYGNTLAPDPPSFWIPIAALKRLDPLHSLRDSPDLHWLYLMGRLRPGISFAEGQVRLTGALQNWLREHVNQKEDFARRRIELTPGRAGMPHMQHNYAETLQLLLGISAVVLLITCANIANFLLARGAARGAETSIRLALGASPARLVRQRLTESLVLALAGGGLGLAVAFAGTKAMVALVFRSADFVPVRLAPDLRVLAFALGLSCLTAVFFGLLPAMQIRPVARGAKGGSRFGAGKMLIAVEVALALVVLTSAGSFARSLKNVTGQEFGFRGEDVLVVHVDPVAAHLPYDRLGPMYRQIYARLNALPGVESASLSYYSPFNDCCWGEEISIEGFTPNPKDPPGAYLNRVSPHYFETIGTKVLRGRTFSEHDTAASQRVAVASEEFVRLYLGSNPVGRHIGIGDAGRNDIEIVGVVGNAKYTHPRDPATEMVFLPLLQVRADATGENRNNLVSTIEIRTAGKPGVVAGEVRAVLREVAPGLPVLRVSTLVGDLRDALNQDHVIADLAGFFGVLALVLTCIGLYGLMAWTVQRRTGEIGVRTALGADRGAVMWMVMREAATQGGVGILIGVPATVGVARLIASQLYGLSATDPLGCVFAAVLLMVCIAAAGYLPARRAASIDPAVALRYE